MPIRIEESARKGVKQILLYVSKDQGGNWELVGGYPPDTQAAHFTAPADGLYWFRVATLDERGKQSPPDLFSGTPNLKVRVQTGR